MADEGALVGVGVAAAAAVLGVEGVLELGQRLGGVLDAEVDDALARGRPRASRPRSAISGSSALRTKRVRPAALGDRRRPLVGQRLDLAVAVELVAEEVAEHDQRGVELLGDPRQPGLVDLEEALAAALLEQRRGDSPGHVRAGPVVDRRAPVGGEHRGDHPRRRRLAVGGADDRRRRRSSRAPRRAIASGSRRSSTRPGRVVPPPRPLARLAAPIARAARRLAPNSAPSGPAHSPARGGTITLSARGSTRSEAGRSVRCSPSA